MKAPHIQQTKLYHAAFCQAVATIGLCTGLATFGEWATFSATLFTLYGIAHVTDTHLQQQKKIPLEDQTA